MHIENTFSSIKKNITVLKYDLKRIRESHQVSNETKYHNQYIY